jgi:hypothetical protein
MMARVAVVKLRHRIVAAGVEGVTAADSAQG